VRDQRLLDLGLTAKAVAGGVFLSGRCVRDILATSAMPRRTDGTPIQLHVDQARGLVHATSPDGLARTAVRMGDQGTSLLLPTQAEPQFSPRTVPRAPEPWPHPPGTGSTALDDAVALAFPDDADIATAALVVVHKGRIVAERYRSGITADTPLQIWSIGKSLLAMQIGIAVGDGLLDPDAPLGFPEWAAMRDPRRAITLAQCLQMASGLGFSAEWAPDWRPGQGIADHGFIYGGLVDSAALMLASRLATPPGEVGVYRNSDTIALQLALSRALAEAGHDLHIWPHERLYAPLGCSAVFLECDPFGTPLLSGWVFATARDVARLAQLMLQDGLWEGRQLMPRGWAALMATPAPGWRGRYWMAEAPSHHRDSIYGHHLWLNRFAPEDRWPLPADARFMLGVGGQYAWIIPSLDLVIVRLGHVRGMLERGRGREPLATAFGAIAAAMADFP
jgi:CubicO group peptidase (beta-lactamase class C family)